MNESTLRVERVFNLGDYKSFRSSAMESNLTHNERVLVMIDNVADSYEQFFIHQLVEAMLYDNGKEDVWREKINELKEVRVQLYESLTETEEENE